MSFFRLTEVILVLLVAVTLAACGGSDSSSSKVAQPVEEATSPATETEPTVTEAEPAVTEAEPAVTETNPPIDCSDIHPYEKYIAIGDSITAGTGDDIAADNVTDDGCYKSRGFPPVLIDRLNEVKGRRHYVDNKAVPGDRSLDGSEFVGSLLGREAMHYLILYGTNDTYGVTDGFGADPSEFMLNMQNIIDQIHAAGKNAYLAKIPPVLGEENTGPKYQDLDQGPRNQLIQQYNKIIDDLVRKNGINVAPPDFYSFFKGHPEFYSDNVHLNGAGYQRMADLWLYKISSL